MFVRFDQKIYSIEKIIIISTLFNDHLPFGVNAVLFSLICANAVRKQKTNRLLYL